MGRFLAIFLALTLGKPACTAAGEPARYLGAGTCAASNCHGSVTPKRDSPRSRQDEYITWFKRDRHAHAAAVLDEERSLAIARRLGMAERPADAARCLDCHALNAPAAERGARFDLRDGVSCEACHGPAGGWIERHTDAGWTHAQSVTAGMIDTRDATRGAESCFGCHLGDAQKTVDHTLIAAGHPALVFELDTFAANLPPHWSEREENASWFRAGPWAVGQAMALREAARRTARQSRGGGWPEFSGYDCFACHHDLGGESWRQARGGVSGRPMWDASRYAVLAVLVRVVAPDLTGALETAVGQLDRAASDGPVGGTAAPAEQVATLADGLLERVRRSPLDRPAVDRLMRAISADGHRLAYDGFRVAQQAAWGLDALAGARETGESPGAPLHAAVAQLFPPLTDPGAYDPARFAHEIGAVGEALTAAP